MRRSAQLEAEAPTPYPIKASSLAGQRLGRAPVLIIRAWCRETSAPGVESASWFPSKDSVEGVSYDHGATFNRDGFGLLINVLGRNLGRDDDYHRNERSTEDLIWSR